MEITGKTKACLAWLNANYNLTSLSVADIVDLTISWNDTDAMENAAQYYQSLQEQKKKEEERKKKEEEEKPRIDFIEETDENGRIWYKRTHWHIQQEESRKLKPGDIIKYETTCPDGVPEEGIMIVNGFDYESDFAARSYVQLTTWTKEKDPNYKHKFVYANLAPGIDKFTFATEDEIKKFFTYIKEEEYEKYFLFYFVRDGKYVPDFIKKEKRYAKYIKNV
jgi:hypothetical protein